MLEIKNITKIYKTYDLEQKALDKVSINFRKSEFVSILGPSGSGKTTLLNIIGGLDKYTSGDLIINGVSTKKYNDRDWDTYRNHKVGFVFQSYNLITHQTVLKNVELALTLSGVSKKVIREKAIKALDDVGLSKHINKKPNQLSGGQMQRVAIARALVNDPDIILADEPTGALDSDTSVQIMELLKSISKDKLVIMVTHNPDLAQNYSSRIINIKDGKLLSDTNPYDYKKEEKDTRILKKTKMSFLTALTLSFNNLMTKKGRTILVSIAGSIGIIGIALILAVSTGFQNYVDSIQEDTLTSYPLTIMQESSDITNILLSMRSGDKKSNGSDDVIEEQYITNMLSSVSTNDLKSFKSYLEKNMNEIKDDVANIQYSYSVDPNIYTIDTTKKISKVNPSNLFTSMMGGNSLMSSYSSMASVYSSMVDDISEVVKDYDVLSGHWPTAYNEMVIVLSEKNTISDLLVYSLGLRDTSELSKMVNSIMSGEEVDIKHDPLKFSYEDLMGVDLRLVLPTDTYKYNKKYDVYEDMSEDESFMKKVYEKATKLKIVGVVSAKEGVTSASLNPGVVYTNALIDYIINQTKDTDIVKKQLKNSEIDVFSGNRFDKENNKYAFSFEDLVKVDEEKLKNAFGGKIDSSTIENKTKKAISEIESSISIDTTPAKTLFESNLKTFMNNILSIDFQEDKIDELVNSYFNKDDVTSKLKNMEKAYLIPVDTLRNSYSVLIKGLLNAYTSAYKIYLNGVGQTFNGKVLIIGDLKNTVISSYLESALINETEEKFANLMTEAKVKSEVLTKVGNLTSDLANSFASSFNIDASKIASAFTLNFSEDELTRVVSAMMSKTETTQKTNLIKLGYQNKEEPTYISFYFNSFDGKEHFLSFIDEYNQKSDEDKKINYSDTTGILMSSVKTIVNAVSYVLIAFVSISLVVSSIMIGVITYISVYERTKEIGILRAIGASKGNISSIFNAETFIIGLLSGLFGIGISYTFIPIINLFIHHFTGNIPLSAALNINHALILVVLSIILTLIGGLIPAKSASKKDPVEALRSE